MAPASKLIRILDGWSNYLFNNKQAEQIAKMRAGICSGCPFAVHGSYEKLMPDYSIKEAQGMKCDICECPLSTKLRSIDETCPKSKW